MYFRHAAAVLPFAVALIATPVRAQEGDAPEEPGVRLEWVKGPAKVDLGKDLAEIEVPEGYQFADAQNTRLALESMGNQTDGSELGMIVSSAEDQQWFVVFEWQPIGYVKDAEKEEIDADALLESIQDATEEGNEWRKENGIPALHVTGWGEAPNYDAKSHNLVWATLAKSEGRDGLSTNYNMRLLGRRGVISATLVDSAEGLQQSKPLAVELVKGFAFKSGSSYSEWKSGDKIAEYGLTGLVAAGAGAAAFKLGFFGVIAKFFGKLGKAAIALVVAVGAGLSKLFNVIRGKKNEGP